MIALGFIVILLAALVGLAGFWLTTSNNTQMAFSAGPFFLELAPVTVFITGLAAMGLLWLGWTMLRSGTKRTVRSRRERRQLERDQREQERQLAVTRARLDEEQASGSTHSQAPDDRPPL